MRVLPPCGRENYLLKMIRQFVGRIYRRCLQLDSQRFAEFSLHVNLILCIYWVVGQLGPAKLRPIRISQPLIPAYILHLFHWLIYPTQPGRNVFNFSAPLAEKKVETLKVELNVVLQHAHIFPCPEFFLAKYEICTLDAVSGLCSNTHCSRRGEGWTHEKVFSPQ